jgi:ribosomal protein S27AE
MRVKLIPVLIVVLLMVPAFGALAESSLIDQPGTVTETRRYDLGRSTKVGADFTLGDKGWAAVAAGFHFEAGVALPIDVIVSRPVTVARGADIPVSVDVQGTDAGRFWLGFYGWASVFVLGYNMSLAEFEIPLRNYAEFSVPVGNARSQTFSTSDIQIAQGTVDLVVADITATLYFNVVIELTTDSYVTGNVGLAGRCIDGNPSRSCTWSGTMPETLTGRLSATAFPFEGFDVQVSDLEYHLTKMQMRIKSFSVGVGFSGSVAMIPYNEPHALQATVPLGDFSPAMTVFEDRGPRGRAATGSGLFMDAKFIEPLASISIPVTVPVAADIIFMNPFILGMIVAVAVAGSYAAVRRRRRKNAVTGVEYHACSECGEPVWFQPQFNGWYCNRCVKTTSWGPIKTGKVSYFGCPDCLKPVAWVGHMRKWSCGHCGTNPSSGPIIEHKK